MKRDNVLPIVCFFMSLLLLGLCYVVNEQEKIEIVGVDTILTTKIDTLWKDTTITKTKTKVKYIQVVKTDTVYDKQGNEIELITDNKTYSDTILCGRDTIDYQIHISGIKSRLDSVSLRLKKSEVIKTNTITVEKYIKEPKRFGVGVQTGIGYGFASKQIEPYVGVGLSINF